MFDSKHVQELGRNAHDVSGSGERACPACGNRSIRMYRYFSQRISGPTMISYVWCSHCRRYEGATGPRPPGLSLTDPLTPGDHAALDYDLAGLLDYLDHLWDIGKLPQ